MTTRQSLNEKASTRCQCAPDVVKPHMEKGGVIVWCDNCGKIIAIPLVRKRGSVIDLDAKVS